MRTNQDALEKLYSNVNLICNQWTHSTSDFENEFSIKSKLDKQISESVKESMKTCLADSYISSELIFNIINAEDDTEILSFIEAEQSEA